MGSNWKTDFLQYGYFTFPGMCNYVIKDETGVQAPTLSRTGLYNL